MKLCPYCSDWARLEWPRSSWTLGSLSSMPAVKAPDAHDLRHGSPARRRFLHECYSYGDRTRSHPLGASPSIGRKIPVGPETYERSFEKLDDAPPKCS
jgi:hypothetical protein